MKSKDSSPKARQDKVVLDSEESGVDNKVKICPSPHGKASTNDAHQTTAARPCARKKTAKRLLHSRATQISQQCSVSEATIRELEESRDRLESECVSLRNKLNYVEEELKTRIDCWKSVQRDRDFNLALQGQQLTISSLNEEIKILRGQATFIRPLDIDGVQSRLVQMRQLFDDIAYHAGKAFLGYARLPEDLPGRLAQARDAQDLLRHTITGREDGAMTLNEVGETINSMSSHHVLRGILASALCESVFESDWPNFDRTHSQLLRAKETCIELQEGQLPKSC